jgi:hypothetical protein
MVTAQAAVLGSGHNGFAFLAIALMPLQNFIKMTPAAHTYIDLV